MSRAHVVALAVLDMRQLTFATRILIGVRAPDYNAVHPNVVSVPTERVPPSLGMALADQAALGSPLATHAHAGTSEAGYSAKSIFCQKLGAATAVESGLLRISAAAKAVFDGEAPSPEAGDALESLRILNVAAYVSDFAVFPKKTPSYQHLSAVPVGEFLDRVVLRSSFVFAGREYRLGGLCILSTTTWLQKSLSKNRKVSK